MRFGIYCEMQSPPGKSYEELTWEIGERAIVSDFGGPEHWKSIETQQLFAQHVMPVFRQRTAGAGA